MPIWPNFFIAGAPKSGTSSLYAYLQAIPGIYLSRVKEPNYFSRELMDDDHPYRPIRDEQQYLQLFAAAGDARVVGEASPTYLADPGAARLIDRTVPGARILASLRDPVERAYSHYLMMQSNGTARGGFLQEFQRGLALRDNRRLPLLRPEIGLYDEQVRRYREVFGDDRFKILIFEEFMADVPAAMRQVLAFLGIEHDVRGLAAPVYRKYSAARGPLVRFLFGNRMIGLAAERFIPQRARKLVRDRILTRSGPKPQMDAAAREFIRQYYADDVARLGHLLGRPLPWRNFPPAAVQRAP